MHKESSRYFSNCNHDQMLLSKQLTVSGSEIITKKGRQTSLTTFFKSRSEPEESLEKFLKYMGFITVNEVLNVLKVKKVNGKILGSV